jgi:hypothetical protein
MGGRRSNRWVVKTVMLQMMARCHALCVGLLVHGGRGSADLHRGGGSDLWWRRGPLTPWGLPRIRAWTIKFRTILGGGATNGGEWLCAHTDCSHRPCAGRQSPYRRAQASQHYGADYSSRKFPSAMLFHLQLLSEQRWVKSALCQPSFLLGGNGAESHCDGP